MSKPLIEAWSYSRYVDYKLCPLKFKLKYIDKIKEPGSAAMDRGTDMHSIAESYVNIATGRKPPAMPSELHNVREIAEYLRVNDAIAEVEWGFTAEWKWTGRPGWFGKDVWYRAKCDVHVLYDDNTALVGDWKSGKKYATNEEQMELFALATKMRYPNLVEVDTRLWYLDIAGDDNEVQRVYHENDFITIQADWQRKVVPMFKDRKFAPKPNDRCRWCHYRRDNGGPCKF